MLKGFPPIVGEDARILILGSMPSVSSLEEQAYYAHPQNAFWPIMSELCAFDIGLPYAERCQAIAKRGIAVWDVIQQCEREGSLDSAINKQSLIVNDFEGFFAVHPNLSCICFNGGMAEQTFKRHCGRIYKDKGREFIRLSSSSPANARVSRQEKILQWRNSLLKRM